MGEFEQMYRNSATTPWHQDEQSDWIDVGLTGQMLQDIGPFGEIHDLGCGLGHYLELMRERIGAANCKCFGYDISATACAKAKQQFPEFEFAQLDLTLASQPQSSILNPQSSIRRLFMIRGTLWYVFPKLDVVVATIRGLMTEGDKLLVVQNFPPLTTQFIGKEVIPNYEALINHFSSTLVSVRHIWYEDKLKAVNDNWFIGLFSIKDI